MIFSKVVNKIKLRIKLMTNPQLAEKLETLKKNLKSDKDQLVWYNDQFKQYKVRIEATERLIESIETELRNGIDPKDIPF